MNLECMPESPNAPASRKERQFQFENPPSGGWGWMSSSDSLLSCARAQLALALEDRHKPVSSWPNNHYSEHAPGAIILVISGLEAWLNESCSRVSVHFPGARRLTVHGLGERYIQLGRMVGGEPFDCPADLVLLIYARNEVEHFLPRSVGNANKLPDWLAPLLSRGLLINHDEFPGMTLLSQRFSSYRLAYWAFETVEKAAVLLEEHMAKSTALVSGMLGNFSSFRGVFPPDRLEEHDQNCIGLLNTALKYTEVAAMLKPGWDAGLEEELFDAMVDSGKPQGT
jgi:hypothetical protein